jgi:hypothetical protein
MSLVTWMGGKTDGRTRMAAHLGAHHAPRGLGRCQARMPRAVIRPIALGLCCHAEAHRLTPILPAMRLAAPWETARLHRVAGLTGDRTALVTTHPCRAQPDTISAGGLIGGRGQHTFPPDRHSPPSPRHSWSPRLGGPGRT